MKSVYVQSALMHSNGVQKRSIVNSNEWTSVNSRWWPQRCMSTHPPTHWSN